MYANYFKHLICENLPVGMTSWSVSTERCRCHRLAWLGAVIVTNELTQPRRCSQGENLGDFEENFENLESAHKKPKWHCSQKTFVNISKLSLKRDNSLTLLLSCLWQHIRIFKAHNSGPKFAEMVELRWIEYAQSIFPVRLANWHLHWLKSYSNCRKLLMHCFYKCGVF